jgi:hypothetical protein
VSHLVTSHERMLQSAPIVPRRLDNGVATMLGGTPTTAKMVPRGPADRPPGQRKGAPPSPPLGTNGPPVLLLRPPPPPPPSSPCAAHCYVSLESWGRKAEEADACKTERWGINAWWGGGNFVLISTKGSGHFIREQTEPGGRVFWLRCAEGL